MSQYLRLMSSFHTSFEIHVVSLDGRNSRGVTNTKGTVEGTNIKTLGNMLLFFVHVVSYSGMCENRYHFKYVF